MLPLPFFCSAVTALMIAFLRLSPYLYIPLILLFVALLVYGLFSTSVFVFEMVDKLKESQVKEADDRLKVESSLDRMSMQFDSSLPMRRLSSRRRSSHALRDKMDGMEVSMQRRFSKPRLSVSGINMNPQDHDKFSTSSASSNEDLDKGDSSPLRSDFNDSNEHIAGTPKKVHTFKPKGKVSLQGSSTPRGINKSKKSSKAKRKLTPLKMLTGRDSSRVISQSEVNAQGYPNGMHSLNISNVIWDSDSSEDASNTISQTPTVVKVVRAKSRKLVKSTSKKKKRTKTNRNLLKKQKLLSQNMLSAVGSK